MNDLRMTYGKKCLRQTDKAVRLHLHLHHYLSHRRVIYSGPLGVVSPGLRKRWSPDCNSPNDFTSVMDWLDDGNGALALQKLEQLSELNATPQCSQFNRNCWSSAAKRSVNLCRHHHHQRLSSYRSWWTQIWKPYLTHSCISRFVVSSRSCRWDSCSVCFDLYTLRSRKRYHSIWSLTLRISSIWP